MNEEMNQPSYDELVQRYNALVKDFERFQIDYTAIKADRILERLNVMMDIIKNKESFSDDIVKLAEWHMKKIMEKPKK